MSQADQYNQHPSVDTENLVTFHSRHKHKKALKIFYEKVNSFSSSKLKVLSTNVCSFSTNL